MMESNQRHGALVEADSRMESCSAFARSVAVVIGINEYANGISRLGTPINDATRLAQLLTDEHGYDVHLLTQNVTKGAFTAFFRETLPTFNLSHQDRLLLYFAGHGIALDGEDGPAGYLIPQDARPEDRSTFLPMTELHGWLSALDCRHVLAILDCCFAGAFRWAGTRHLSPLPEVLHKERYERFIRDPAWQVLTSAAYDQKALDILAGNVVGARDGSSQIAQQHSPFALALFDALAGAGDGVPKGAGDGVITATELYLYLRDSVEVRADERIGHRQTPGLWPLEKHDKGEYIFLVPDQELNLPPAPELTAKNNPYRGLQSYNEEHADLFFGRQALIEMLARQVATQPLTLVVGASGTGKSSLVKAGVAPYLTRTAHRENAQQAPSTDGIVQVDNATTWYALRPLRPTEIPLQAMVELIAEHLPGSPELPGTLEPEPSIETALNHWFTSYSDRKLLLIVDQFEELVTLCRDTGQRRRFQALLTKLLDTYPEQLRIVLTLRTDFEPQFDESPLAEHWRQGRFVVPPMTQAELRSVIERPASVRVLFFEPPELIDTLIDEVIQTPSALPLLSFTLEQLYLKYLKRQEAAQAVGDTIERALTQADYAELGGVIGSLRTRADEEYRALPDDAHRATMQRIMLRMVAVEGGELTRRRVPLAELVYPSAAENARVAAVIERLVAARLLVSNSHAGGKDGLIEAYIEPTHDALVRAWDRLLAWQKRFEEDSPLQRLLTMAANDWGQEGSNPQSGLLWNNNPRLPRLEAILVPRANGNNKIIRFRSTMQQLWPSAQVTHEPTWLNRIEIDFVQKSVLRRAGALKQVVGFTLTAIVALGGLALFAFYQQGQAITNANARATEVVVRSTAEAIALTREAEAINAGQTAVAEAEARVAEAAIRATAEAIARIREADAVAAEAEARAEAAVARSRQIAEQSAIAFTDHDTELALLLAVEAGKAAETAEALSIIYQVANQPICTKKIFQGHQAPVFYAEFNQDASTLSTVSSDRTIRRWNVMSGREVTVIHAEPLRSEWQATWSHDETKILVQGGGHGRILNAVDGQEIMVFNDYDMSNTGGSWSNDDSKILAPVDNDPTAQIWSAVDGQIISTLYGHSSGINHASWSRHDTKILTASWDKTVRIWNVTTGQQLNVLAGHTDNVVYAAWNSNETRVVSASLDGTARIWNANTGEELFILAEDEHNVITHAIWSQDDTKILTYGWHDIVRVWDAQTGQELMKLQEGSGNSGGGKIQYANWNSDGTQILTVGCDESEGLRLSCVRGSARVWDVTTGTKLSVLKGGSGAPLYASWNRDETMILTSGEDTIVRLWSTVGCKTPSKHDTSEAEIERIRAEHAVGRVIVNDPNHIDFSLQSHSGAWILRGDNDNFRIIDTISTEEVARLQGSVFGTIYASWSPDDLKIVMTFVDNKAVVWDAKNGNQLITLPHTTMVQWAEWNHDSTKILSYSEDGTSRLWDAKSGQTLMTLRNSTAWSADHSTVIVIEKNHIIGTWATKNDELLAAVCLQAPRNLTWDEWNRYMDEPYRPTCIEALLPLDVIEATTNEAKYLAQSGDLSTATERLGQLVGWLHENGQFNTFGVERAEWLAALQAGENPWAEAE